MRHGEGAFVVEGPTLLATALDAGAHVESVFVAADEAVRPGLERLLERAHGAGARLFELAPGVLERVADTVTPQPVVAIVTAPAASGAELADASFVVVCAEVRDPGNAGAVIRAADAAGADAVVCCRGTADPFNPKTVRASAGSVLHLPVLNAGPTAEVLADLGSRQLRRMAAVAHGGTPHTEADLRVPLALVLGNEVAGLPEELDDLIDERLTIEMSGRAESLNVSAAAAVLSFEVRRQRATRNLRAVPEDGT